MCRTARTPARGAEAQGVHRGQLIQPLSEEGLHRVGAAGTARMARGVSIGEGAPELHRVGAAGTARTARGVSIGGGRARGSG